MTVDYKSLDWKFILATVGLSLIGIMLIYSAHYDSSAGSSLNFYKIGRASCRERV